MEVLQKTFEPQRHREHRGSRKVLKILLFNYPNIYILHQFQGSSTVF